MVNGANLGVGNHKIKVTVTDTVGITGIYSDREPRCFKSDSIMVRVTQGNNAVKPVKRNSFSISPNPAEDKIVISSNEFVDNFKFEITDQNGKVVLIKEITSDVCEIDISTLTKGLYFVTFSDKKSVVERQKLVISR